MNPSILLQMMNPGIRQLRHDISILTAKQHRQHVAAEAESSGTGSMTKETEYAIYARLTDFTQLQKAASVEEQEQWMIRLEKTDKNAASGSIRVRRVQVKDADPQYLICTKTKLKAEAEGASTSAEVEIPTTEENFIQFRFLADQGMLKHRYCFPILGSERCWEVDVYPDGNGGYHEWVKIDYETDNPEAQLPELPMQFAEVIMPPGFPNDGGDQREDRVWMIYDRCFLRKNIYLQKIAEVQTDQPKQDESQQKEKTKTPEENTAESAAKGTQSDDQTQNE